MKGSGIPKQIRVPPKSEPKQCTKPKPFQLESLARHEEEMQKEMEERIRVETGEAQRRVFMIKESTSRSATKNLAMPELRAMVHALFLESGAGVELASPLLFVVLTVCVSHEAQSSGSKRPRSEDATTAEHSEENQSVSDNKTTNLKSKNAKGQGPVAAFDSYVLAAVCALACEVQLYPLISGGGNFSKSTVAGTITKPVKINGSSNEYGAGICWEKKNFKMMMEKVFKYLEEKCR